MKKLSLIVLLIVLLAASVAAYGQHGQLQNGNHDSGSYGSGGQHPYCTWAVCGNGVLEEGEECDDGNTIDGDGCSSDCQLEDIIITFCKFNAETNEPIPGWSLELERFTNGAWERWYGGTTGEDGCFGTYIPPGTYRAGEQAQDGWELDHVLVDGVPLVAQGDWTIPFTIKVHEEHTVAFFNRRTTEECLITICKKEDKTNNGPSEDDEYYTKGWTFAIIPQQGENKLVHSDEDGCGETTIPPGQYRIMEASKKNWTYTGKTVDGKITPNNKNITACKNKTVTFYNYHKQCGNGIQDEGEQCDAGEANGAVCEPAYGESCTYCSETCTLEEVPGPYCGDGIKQDEYEECDGEDGVNEYQTCTEDCTVNWENACTDILHLDMEDAHASRVAIVDRDDASATTVVDIEEKLRSVLAASHDGTLYSMRPKGGATGDLVIINGDGSVTPIGPTGLPGNTVAMEFAPDGTLYAMNQKTNKLYTVDTSTGAATAVGTLDFGVAGGDLVVTEYNEIVYVKIDGRVFVIDPETLAYRLVGTLPPGSYTSSAYFEGTHYAMDRSHDRLYTFTLDPWNYTLVGQNGPFQYGDGTSCVSDEYCGDGVVNGNEECDLGSENGAGCEPPYGGSCSACTARCEREDIEGPYCGDGIRQLPYEECDGTDGVGEHERCSEECTIVEEPYCGDGIVNQPSEECDGEDGVQEGEYCTEDCHLVHPECGNGVVEEGEECDDGNRVERDGCNNNCQKEQLTCTEANKAGYLTATINNGDVTITNNWKQEYEVGAAVYKRTTDRTDDEVLFDYELGIAPAEGTTELHLNTPDCAYELDVFCGDVLYSHDGVRYGKRKIAYHISEDEYCSSWCGDGVVDEDEECEPDVPLTTGVCNEICEIVYPECGNGVLEYSEECDAGDENGAACEPPYGGSCTYCTEDCTSTTIEGPYCGDGIINGDEECDGEAPEGLVCIACRLEAIPDCGDGIVQAGEECDAGDENGVACQPAYGKSCQWCTAECELVTEEGGFCGDEVIEGPEECDAGEENGQRCDAAYGESCSYCSAECTEETELGPYCGDGVRQWFEEECDLGSENGVSCEPGYDETCTSCTDACRRSLEVGPYCGDGIKQDEYEECDGEDGVPEGYYCTSECTLEIDEPGPTCGNGVVEEGEECDDGNRVERDGCNNNCQEEQLTCTEANKAGYLTATINNGDVTITNNWKQEYEVGAAVYKRPTPFTDDEELFDYELGIAPAEGTTELHLNTPDCAYELDVFCGDVIEDRHGQRYGVRKLASELVSGEACPYCGDGVKNGAEECDGEDGVPEGYYCTSECTLAELPACGDGVVEEPEECDAGDENGAGCEPAYGDSCTYCSETCTLEEVPGPYCGDGIKQDEYEECDDGNADDTDGCTQDCLQCAMAGLRADLYGGRCCEGLVLEGGLCNVPSGPYCGDSVVNGNEECDLGSENGAACEPPYGGSCTYCTEDCTSTTIEGPYCGDGIINGDEECEDGVGVTADDMVCENCHFVDAPSASLTLLEQDGNTFSFRCDATGFEDPVFDWTMGDGTSYEDTPSVVHSYGANGEYLVTCTASEDALSASDWTTVTVDSCEDFTLTVTSPVENAEIPAGEEFTVYGTLTGEGNTNGEEVLVNGLSTWVLTDDAWSKVLTAPEEEGPFIIEAVHENSCGAEVKDSVSVLVVSTESESVDQRVDNTGGENLCGSGYRKTSHGCERIKPEVVPVAAAEEPSVHEPSGDQQPSEESAQEVREEPAAASPEPVEQDVEQNSLTGAAIGGGTSSLLWLFVVLALIGLSLIGYYVMRL